MSQVDFYISQQTDDAARLNILLRLLPKALQQAQGQLLIIGDDEAQLTQLSEQLWESVVTSFLVHEKLTTADKASPAPILLAEPSVLELASGFNINIAFDLTTHLSTGNITLAYPRVIVIGNQNPNQLVHCREKYKAYQNQGITPKTVKV